jgi:hypothetical protein
MIIISTQSTDWDTDIVSVAAIHDKDDANNDRTNATISIILSPNGGPANTKSLRHTNTGTTQKNRFNWI